MNAHHGQCHCGNIEVWLETALAPAAWPLRECQCTFCRKHGSRALTDPAGALRIVTHDAGRVIHHRFGQKTADFLICARCGVFVVAVMTESGREYATLNANALDCGLELTQTPAAVDYDRETREERTARRAARWTPVT